MDVGNRDIGGLALEKYRNLTSLFDLVNSFNELCVFAVCCPTKFMTCSLIIFNSDHVLSGHIAKRVIRLCVQHPSGMGSL